MNYDHTIKALEEKRDFYAAAVTALRKIQQSEQGWPTAAPKKAAGKRGRRSGYIVTPEQRARYSEAARQRWAARRAKANGSDHATPVTSAPEPVIQ